jgi:hypothetical protein
MLPSRFLKQDEVPQPVLVTISNITQEIMDKDSGETKWAMHFEEFEKPLALNSTNIQISAMACGSDNTDDWLGKKIVLYTDPNVSFAGKIVGGLRLRAAKNQPKPAPKPVGGIAEMEDDGPPF